MFLEFGFLVMFPWITSCFTFYDLHVYEKVLVFGNFDFQICNFGTRWSLICLIFDKHVLVTIYNPFTDFEVFVFMFKLRLRCDIYI